MAERLGVGVGVGVGVGQVRSGEVGCRRMVCLDGGHASVAERLHARYWHGDVH